MNNENKTKLKLLTIKQSAEVIEGLTEYRIRQLCRTGQLPCVMAGRKYLINEKTLISFIAALDKEGR